MEGGEEAMCKGKDFIGREKGKCKTVLWINSILDVLIRKSVLNRNSLLKIAYRHVFNMQLKR